MVKNKHIFNTRDSIGPLLLHVDNNYSIYMLMASANHMSQWKFFVDTNDALRGIKTNLLKT